MLTAFAAARIAARMFAYDCARSRREYDGADEFRSFFAAWRSRLAPPVSATRWPQPPEALPVPTR